MRRLFPDCLLCLCALTCSAGKFDGPQPSRQSARRIDQIAARLEARPRVYAERLTVHESTRNDYINAPVPDLSDDLYLKWQREGTSDVYNTRASHKWMMLDAFAAMAVEGGDAALRRAVEFIDSFCRQRSWANPNCDTNNEIFNRERYHVDLGTSDVALHLAQAISILGHKVSPALRARAMAELERRVFAPYRATCADSASADAVKKQGHWWFYGKSNWNPYCHAGVVLAALAVLEDKRDRARFIEAAERGLPFYFGSFYEDGYCIEGAGYWDYGFGRFLRLAYEVRKATGGFVDFTKIRRAKSSFEYALCSQLAPGVYPKFADGGGYGPAAATVDLGVELWPETRALKNGRLPLRNLYPVAQVYLGRGKRFSVVIKGGNNGEVHGHHDVGSWNVALDGQIIAGDPGPEVYTASTFDARRYESKINNSYGHPVPTVDGELQSDGASAAAHVVATNFTDNVDEFALDLSAAYASVRERKLGTICRKVAVKRGRSESVVIADVFKMKRGLTLESAFVTTADVTVGKDGASFLLTGDGTVATVRIGVRPAVKWRLKQERIANPGRADVTRLAVVTEGPEKTLSVGWRLEAGKKL